MTCYYASPLVASCLLLLLSASNLSPVKGQFRSEPPPPPSFPEPIANVTVAEGRSATLVCVVENLGDRKLAWIHRERHMLLTLHNSVIANYPKVSIRTDNPKNTWWLQINDVRPEDAGGYMCQLNTDPMISIIGYLHVVVPPSIDEEGTSSDIDIREGSDAKLKCRASGSPQPDIIWRREHDRKIIISTQERVTSYTGEELHLKKTSRLSMGAYFCIASNTIQPSVSKRITLNVFFPPMLLIPGQLIGACVGEDVSLICNLESNPRAITYWLLAGNIYIISNTKYQVNLNSDTSPRAYPYRVEMELRIIDLRPQDFGNYTCVARNSLGENQGIITLYEKPNPNPMLSAKTFAKDNKDLVLEVKQSSKMSQNNEKQDMTPENPDSRDDYNVHSALPGVSAVKDAKKSGLDDDGYLSDGSTTKDRNLTEIILQTLLVYHIARVFSSTLRKFQ